MLILIDITVNDLIRRGKKHIPSNGDATKSLTLRRSLSMKKKNEN